MTYDFVTKHTCQYVCVCDDFGYAWFCSLIGNIHWLFLKLSLAWKAVIPYISVSIRYFSIKNWTPNLFAYRVHQTPIHHQWNCVYELWILYGHVSNLVCSYIQGHKTNLSQRECQLQLQFSVVFWLKIKLQKLCNAVAEQGMWLTFCKSACSSSYICLWYFPILCRALSMLTRQVFYIIQILPLVLTVLTAFWMVFPWEVGLLETSFWISSLFVADVHFT